MKHLGLPKIAECSMHADKQCKLCKRKLYTERSIRSNGQLWYITEDGKFRHPASSCRLIPLRKTIDGKPIK